MSTQIHTAIKFLESYKNTSSENQFTKYDASEIKRRESYINNLIRELSVYISKPSLHLLDLILDDLHEVTAHNFFKLGSEDFFAKILHKAEALIKNYRVKTYTREKIRDKIKNYFIEFPQAIGNLDESLQKIIHNLKNELVVIHADAENFIMPFKRGAIKLEKVHHVLPSKNGETDEQSDPNLIIVKPFIQLILHFQHYQDQLQQFHKMSSVNTIKANIRHIYRIGSRLAKTGQTILNAQGIFLNLVNNLYSAVHQQQEHSKICKFLQEFFCEVEALIETLHGFNNASCLIFAYVMDESVIRLRRKNVLSRLDLVLAGKDFEPLDEKRMQESLLSSSRNQEEIIAIPQKNPVAMQNHYV